MRGSGPIPQPIARFAFILPPLRSRNSPEHAATARTGRWSHARYRTVLTGALCSRHGTSATKPVVLASAVFVTCAVTGSGDSVKKSAHVPVTPQQIAAAALEAHAAGAAIVHLHVRDPASGAPSRDPALFREVCERIRDRNSEVIINLTGGMGGDLILGDDDAPLKFGRGTDFVGPRERMTHILELLPEIGSLDCGSLNFDEALYGTTPRYLRTMAQEYRS